MLPPPAIMTRLTAWSMRLSSCMTWRMSFVAARQNTSSPACTTVSPSGRIGLSPRNMAGKTRVHGRNVLPQVLQGMTDQGTALECTHRDQAHFAVGKLEHLQRFGKLDQLDDVVGKDLLRADCQIHVKAVRAEHALVGEIVGGAQADDAGWNVEQLL